MDFVFSEMATAKLFERLFSSFWDKIEPHFTLRVNEQPRPPYAHGACDQLRLDF